MKIIVLGKSGQLAKHLRILMPEAEFWGRERFDISNTLELEAALRRANPSAVINAAAYTAVDRAESEPALAWCINAEAPAAAARAAAALGVPLIHISTDYVFDGRSSEPYIEDSPVNPLNTYGRTKLAGELAVASICPRHLILRTSWVFSEYGHNFVKTMIRKARECDTLCVVSDQFGRPTYAGDLARLVTAVAAEKNIEELLPPGIYHAVGGPVTSWHRFAEAIIDECFALGLITRRPTVKAISSADYPTRAERPQRAVLSPSTITSNINGVSLNWKSTLTSVLLGKPEMPQPK